LFKKFVRAIDRSCQRRIEAGVRLTHTPPPPVGS
jgi:hypothetical protein